MKKRIKGKIYTIILQSNLQSAICFYTIFVNFNNTLSCSFAILSPVAQTIYCVFFLFPLSYNLIFSTHAQAVFYCFPYIPML